MTASRRRAPRAVPAVRRSRSWRLTQSSTSVALALRPSPRHQTNCCPGHSVSIPSDEAMWSGARFESDKTTERKHYAVVRALAGNRLVAIQYLYGRLSIIDAKTGSLLQVNGVLFAIITFMTSAIFQLSAVEKTAGSPATQTVFNLARISNA